MISYRVYNEVGEKPELQKVITVGSESFVTNLTPSNKDELNNIEPTVIKQHMLNLLDYSKNLSSEMEMYSDDEAGEHAYPIKNLEETMKYTDEVCQWWYYIWEVTSINGLKLVLSAEDHDALHGLDTPHFHDTETGQTFYGDTGYTHTHDEDTGDVVYVEATTTGETTV